MPSGAKKRKAAKKKKEQEANIITSSTNNTNKSNNDTPLGNDVPKSQDERVSDGVDVGSPASQDLHNQQRLFNVGNKESEKRDPKSTVEFPRDVKDTANVGAEGNGAAKIQREMKSRDDLGDQNISFKHVECVKESDDGSSSSSSSDNESQAVEKPSKKAIQGTEKPSSGKVADDSVVESAPAVDVKDTANVGAEGNGAAKIQREMKSRDDLGDQNISIKHVECVKESDDGSSSSSSSDNESQAVEKPSKKAIQGTEKPSSGKVADDSVVESAPAVDSIKPLVTVAPDLVESRLKENEELKRNEDEVFPVSEESVDVSLIVVEPVTNENEGKNLPLPVAPESSNGAKNTGDSEITASSENQALLASAPRVEQRTSWLSCCGLFDVLTGSR